MRGSRAFTLVEVAVATVVLAVGVLAALASARAAQRLATLGERVARAAEVASSRFERLRPAGCAGAGGGTASHGSTAETWSVATGPGGVIADVVVTFVAADRVRTVRFRESWPCTPPAPAAPPAP
jgi:prepilin-type N-terminal cleavage/methylation domain-containing protein